MLRQRLAAMEQEIQRLRAASSSTRETQPSTAAVAAESSSSSSLSAPVSAPAPSPATFLPNDLTLQCKPPEVTQPLLNFDGTVHPSSLNLASPTLEVGARQQNDNVNHNGASSQAVQPVEPAPGSTQYPAAILCDLQCQPAGRLQTAAAATSLMTPLRNFLHLFFLQTMMMMTRPTSSFLASHPLMQILWSLRHGRPLLPSKRLLLRNTMSRFFPWMMILLITTPLLDQSSSTLKTQAAATCPGRLRLLHRFLSLNPTLARPLRDATRRALLRSAVGAGSSSGRGRLSSRPPWLNRRLLLTTIRAIDHIMVQRRRSITRRGKSSSSTSTTSRA